MFKHITLALGDKHSLEHKVDIEDPFCTVTIWYHIFIQVKVGGLNMKILLYLEVHSK